MKFSSLLFVTTTYKDNDPSCSTAKAFRAARMLISSRTANGLLDLRMRRNAPMGTNRRIKLMSAIRLCLGGVRLRTGIGSMRSRQPSVLGRMTTLGRRVIATRHRGHHIRGLLGTKTTGRGRLSSTSTRLSMLRQRLVTRNSALLGDQRDLA